MIDLRTIAVMLAPPLALWAVLSSVDTAPYMPHAHCYYREPWILWGWILGDLVTCAAYLALPGAILQAWRARPDLLPGWVALGFAAFILACGLGHAIDAASQTWAPAYHLRVVWGWLTAALSVWTAVLVWHGLPVLASVVPRKEHDRLQEEIRQVELRVAGSDPRAAFRRRILQDSPLLVAEVDPDGVVRYQEGGALSALGLPRYGWEGREIEAEGALRDHALPAALAGRWVALRLAWGQREYVGIYGPAYDVQGEISGMAGVALDVSDGLIDTRGRYAHG